MIQRIQSVFLLVAAIILLVPFVLPFAVFSGTSGELVYTLASSRFEAAEGPEGVSMTESPAFLPLALTCLAFVGLIVCIFLYKNRKKQIRFAYLLIVVQLGIGAGMGLVMTYAAKQSGAFGVFVLDFGASLGILAPIAAILCTLMAITRIKKDEELVRSADRIR